MRLLEWKGSWALVTGASAGIGREFAMQFAAAGLNLVLVARRGALLEALAQDLRGRHGVDVICIARDLSSPDGPIGVHARLHEVGVKIRLLCNNAASGRWGPFEDATADVYSRMVLLDVSAPVVLCRLLLSDLTSHPSSAIINVSSQAAFQPVPYMAVYAAAKAFIHSFSLALSEEWKDKGVLVQTLVPGPTATEFDQNAGAYPSTIRGRGSADRVVRDAIKHLTRNDVLALNAKGVLRQRLFAALAPPALLLKTVGRMFRPPPGTAGDK